MLLRPRVHSDQLEDKVGHRTEVYYDDARLAEIPLAACEDRGEQQDDNCDRYRCNGQPEFRIAGSIDDNDELDREAEEEEKVELEQGNVDLESSCQQCDLSVKVKKTDLVDQVSPLQAQVCRDVLVDGPRKLVVQLPCHE